MFYNALVQPVMDYCAWVWGDSFISHSNTMLPLQKRAVRIIMDAPWDAPSTALLSELNILPFQERVAKLKAKMASKALNRLLPSYIAEKFLRFSAVHVRETRNSKRNLKLPRIKQSLGQWSLMFSTASLWNRRRRQRS